jgi:hypothetical protein
MRPNAKGGRLRTGNPGNKGGPGRTPDWFKQEMRALVTRQETLAAITRILDDEKHPAFIPAFKAAAEYGYGKATQSVEVTGAEGGPVVVRQTLVFGETQVVF